MIKGMRLIVSFVALAIAVPSWATITQVNKTCTGTSSTDGCSGSGACALTVPSTGSGNLLISSLIVDSSPQLIGSMNGGGTWVHCAACALTSASQAVDASYVLSSTGGVTSISLTPVDGPGGYNFCIYEYSTTASGFVFDAGNTSTITSAAPTAVSLTLTGSNDVVLSAIGWGGTITGVSSPFADFIEPNGNGIADHLNTSSGSGSAFTPNTSNSGISMSIAFKESGGAALPSTDKRKKLEKYDNGK